MDDPKERIEEIAEHFIKRKRIDENSKYGQFIIQTNEVQLSLKWLILFRSVSFTRELEEFLERVGFGTLINCSRICIKYSELDLLKSLKLYKDARDALAHKMFSSNGKLTVTECEKALELGDALLNRLKEIHKEEIAKNDEEISKIK